jgi:hypothetical protein
MTDGQDADAELKQNKRTVLAYYQAIVDEDFAAAERLMQPVPAEAANENGRSRRSR